MALRISSCTHHKPVIFLDKFFGFFVKRVLNSTLITLIALAAEILLYPILPNEQFVPSLP